MAGDLPYISPISPQAALAKMAGEQEVKAARALTLTLTLIPNPYP